MLAHAVLRTGGVGACEAYSGARRDVKYARSQTRVRASLTMTMAIYVGHSKRTDLLRTVEQ